MSEKERKTQKRLAAFAPDASPRSKLRPTTIPGVGRVVLETPPIHTDPDLRSVSPKKTRLSSPKKKTKTESNGDDLLFPTFHVGHKGPNWLDSQFPWALRVQEYQAEVKQANEHRMCKLKRWLDRESDEESDNSDTSTHLTDCEERSHQHRDINDAHAVLCSPKRDSSNAQSALNDQSPHRGSPIRLNHFQRGLERSHSRNLVANR